MRVFITYANDPKQQKYPFHVAKSTLVRELKKQIKDELKINQKCQRLFYGGKQLENQNTLMNYGLDTDKIILMVITDKQTDNNVHHQLNEKNNDITMDELSVSQKSIFVEENCNKLQDEKEMEMIESLYYKENDLVDCIDTENGGWFEAFYLKSFKQSERIICEVKFCHNDEICRVTEDCIRPRSKRMLSIKEIEEGQIVLVKYENGHWHDFEVKEIIFKKRKKMLKGNMWLNR